MKKIEFRQLDLTDCGAACLASVCGFYNLNYPLTRIRTLAGTNSKGTNLLGMIEAAEKLGLDTKAVRVNKQNIDKLPLPFIAHLNIQKKWFHFVVVYKIDKDKLHIMDPAIGKLSKVSLKDFLNNWTEVALILGKGSEFKEGNHKRGNLSRFLDLIKPFRSSFTEAFIAACLYSALGITTSIFVEKIIDQIIPSGNLMMLNVISIIFGLLLLSRLFIGFTKNLLLLRTGLKIDSQLIMAYYRHVLRLPIKFFNTMRTGEIISRINDAVKIRSFINNVALDLVVNALIVLFTLLVMLSYSLPMFLIVLGGIPVYYFIYTVFNRFNKKHVRELMEKNASMESSLLETFKGIEPIKSTVNEGNFTDNLDRKSINLLNSGYRVNKSYSVAGTITELIALVQLLLILWIGSGFVIENKLSTGELLSFYTLFGYLSAPLFKLILSNRSLQDALIASDRLFQIMDLEQEDNENKVNTEFIKTHQTGIKFDNVSFKFPGQPELLKKISFQCKPYTITIIAGDSGAGKSTLLTLIVKLNLSNHGEIHFNNNEYRTLTPEYLRKNIAYVSQKPILFSGTLSENILLGAELEDIQKLWKSIEMAGLMEKVEALPDRLNTMVSEDGDNFSGGERQKISIARALYQNPSVLLFDEPTSSMDAGSVDEFTNLMFKLRRQGKTIVIVSHNSNFYSCSDQIIYLKNGEVILQGKLEELIEYEVDFQKYINRQSSGSPGDLKNNKTIESHLIFK
ncbi:MAG: peptidase domain-containing ABC transporter [Bacteroidales bacterium]|nr:peptidase domain-containing ABC transporter [Bacteroidales bacterium]MCF8390408.1 peptidase domain-containing ABC transporter [Bacteroidales bacterium]